MMVELFVFVWLLAGGVAFGHAVQTKKDRGILVKVGDIGPWVIASIVLGPFGLGAEIGEVIAMRRAAKAAAQKMDLP